MSRRPANVTQADIARALRAMQQCNYDGVVEIARDGTIRIVPRDAASSPSSEPNPWDEVLRGNDQNDLDRELGEFEVKHGYRRRT